MAPLVPPAAGAAAFKLPKKSLSPPFSCWKAAKGSLTGGLLPGDGVPMSMSEEKPCSVSGFGALVGISCVPGVGRGSNADCTLFSLEAGVGDVADDPFSLKNLLDFATLKPGVSEKSLSETLDDDEGFVHSGVFSSLRPVCIKIRDYKRW